MLVRALLISLLISTPVLAQDGLGRGDALDNSLSTGGRRNPARTLPRGIDRGPYGSGVLRGRGYNESIDSYSQADIRLIGDAAEASADNLADSLTNSPWYWQNSDRPAVQLFAQGDSNYFVPFVIDGFASSPREMRIGRDISSFAHSWNEDTVNRNAQGELQYPETWSRRQASQYRLTQVIGDGYQLPSADGGPMQVGSVQGIGYLTASPLHGISVESNAEPYAQLGLTAWDAARLREDREAGLGGDRLVVPWHTTAMSIARLGERLDNRLLPGGPGGPGGVDAAPYDLILDRMAEQFAAQMADSSVDPQGASAWIEEQYARLQGDLSGVSLMDFEVSLATGEPLPGDVPEPGEDVLPTILAHGQKVDRLVGGEAGRFNELMRLAEGRLRERSYFWAERRFNRALSFVPGHPLATAGLGHARIGAGLYLSASQALQSLLSLQPEMIDVLYDDALLPTRHELVTAAVTIMPRLDEPRDGGAYGFLLAYIGHQLDDREMISRGLSAMAKHAGPDDELVELLQEIWLPIGPDVTPPAP